MVTFVAVPFQLYSLTGSTLQVGLLSICDAVPLLLFSAIGGTIADRLDRRKLVFCAEIGLMGVVGAARGERVLRRSAGVGAVRAGGCGTSLWALGAPALRALMPGLVPQEQLAASQALQSIYSSTGAIVGPALGGLLIAAAGVGTTYAIDAVEFVASLARRRSWSRRRRRREPSDEQALESLREGWRFLVRQKVILGTFVLDTNAMVFGMPQALFPAVAAHHFDAGARVVGLLYAAPRSARWSRRSPPAGSPTCAARASRSPRRSSSGARRSRASASRPRSGSAW